MKLVLMGPPGAGKGTQGELLVEWLGVPRYSTGDMLRAARREHTALGDKAAPFMDTGELVPDELILGIVEEALDRDHTWDGFVFDGFPRTVEQAEGLDRLLARRARRLDAILSLEAPSEELVQRLSSRRVCIECGEVARTTGSGGPGACAACGGRLIQRSDDQPETVRRRLQVYEQETEPVLQWYRASTVPVFDLDGTGSVEQVHARIRDRLAG